MIALALTLALSVLVLAGGYVCYLCSQADSIVFMSPSGKEYTIDCSHWFGRNASRDEIPAAHKPAAADVEKSGY